MRLLKAGSEVCATDADWIPADGDVMVSIDAAAEVEVDTLPFFLNGWWLFPQSVGETTGKSIAVRIDDVAIQSDGFIIETFGNASAMYPDDFSVASPDLAALIDALPTNSELATA